MLPSFVMRTPLREVQEMSGYKGYRSYWQQEAYVYEGRIRREIFCGRTKAECLTAVTERETELRYPRAGAF
jgi:hypothetical protein